MKKYIYIFIFALLTSYSCDKVLIVDEYNTNVVEEKDNNDDNENSDDDNDDNNNDDEVSEEEKEKGNFDFKKTTWKGNDVDKKYKHKIKLSKYSGNNVEGTTTIYEFGDEAKHVIFKIKGTYKKNDEGKFILSIETVNRIRGNLKISCTTIKYQLHLENKNSKLVGTVDCPKEGTVINNLIKQ